MYLCLVASELLLGRRMYAFREACMYATEPKGWITPGKLPPSSNTLARVVCFSRLLPGILAEYEINKVERIPRTAWNGEGRFGMVYMLLCCCCFLFLFVFLFGWGSAHCSLEKSTISPSGKSSSSGTSSFSLFSFDADTEEGIH